MIRQLSLIPGYSVSDLIVAKLNIDMYLDEHDLIWSFIKKLIIHVLISLYYAIAI